MKKQMRRLLGIVISAMLLITYAFPVMADGHNHHSSDKALEEYKGEDAFTITLTKPYDDKIKNNNAKYGAYQIFSGTVPADGAENAPDKDQLINPGTEGTALPITDIKWGDAFGEVNSEAWKKNIVHFVYALAAAPSDATYSYAFKDFRGFEKFKGSNENELANEFYADPTHKESLDNVKFDKLAIEVAEVLKENRDHEWLQAFTDILGGYATGEHGYLQGNYVTQYYKGAWNEEGTQYEIKVPAGYYMILDLSTIDEGSADDYSEAYSARMLFVANNVTQELKSSVPTLEKKIVREPGKELETEAAGVGDTVTFKLTGTLPTNFDNYLGGYKYIFTDTLSNGLTLNPESVKITVTGLWKEEDGKHSEWYESTPLTISDDSFSSDVSGKDHHLTSEVKAYTIEVTPDKPTADGGQTLTVSFPCLKEIVITDDDNNYILGYNKDGKNYTTSQIYVEYTAIVNKYAVVEPKDEFGINGNKNTAQLEYSDNPQAYEDTDKTTFDDATVYTFGLDITKVDSAKFTKNPDPDEAKLPGAEFVLVRQNPDGKGGFQIAKFENGSIDTWVDLAGATEENLKDTVINELYYEGGGQKPTAKDSILTSNNEDGQINITGLDAGVKYTMVEVKAPDGYATIDPFTFTLTAATEVNSKGEDTGEYNGLLDTTEINKGKSTDGTLSLKGYVINDNEGADDDNGYSELTVANFKYEDLPSTGGIGTYIFYIVGGIIVLGAVVLLFLSRKKKVTE